MAQETVGLKRPDVIAAEFDEIREELKRLDGKARDLLLVATFSSDGQGRRDQPHPYGHTGWRASDQSVRGSSVAWSIVELLLVVRPVIVPVDGVSESSDARGLCRLVETVASSGA